MIIGLDIDKLLEEGHEIYLISNRAYPYYKDLLNTTKNNLEKNLIHIIWYIPLEVTSLRTPSKGLPLQRAHLQTAENIGNLVIVV